MELTQERLKEALDYDPPTGIFRWKIRKSGVTVGMIAGRKATKGHIQIRLDGGRYSAHRLAWLYVYGVDPANQIDHINLIKDDNRIENLREATNSQNQHNTSLRKNNSTGAKGVHKVSGDKFVAMIGHLGQRIYLGIFATVEEASQAYAAASVRYHGEFGRPK